MNISFSSNKPQTPGHYFLKPPGKSPMQVCVVRRQKTSGMWDLPFEYGLSVRFDNSINGQSEDIPLEWIAGEWSEQIEFVKS